MIKKLKAFILTCLFLHGSSSFSQKVDNIISHKPGEDWENTAIEKIADDSLCTSFLIWIKGGVKHHFHSTHTECIYVLEGEGQMELGDAIFQIHTGDYIQVPVGVVHAVFATVPLHVLSIQTPKWKADDRTFMPPVRRPHNE